MSSTGKTEKIAARVVVQGEGDGDGGRWPSAWREGVGREEERG